MVAVGKKTNDMNGIVIGGAIFVSVALFSMYFLKQKIGEGSTGETQVSQNPEAAIVETATPVNKLPIMPPQIPKMNAGVFRPQKRHSDFGQFRMQILTGADEVLPKQALDAMRLAVERQKAAFESETAAREALSDLEACVSQSGRVTPPALPAEMQRQLPKEMKKQLDDLPLLAQAECIKTARQLADKFPSIRQTVEIKVVAKADRKALKMADGQK